MTVNQVLLAKDFSYFMYNQRTSSVYGNTKGDCNELIVREQKTKVM